MFFYLLQRAFSIVGGARQSLLSVRKPSESESIFFMIDCSRLCCSSWSSLTYSSTSSFREGNHTQENRALQSMGHNGGGTQGYHMLHLPQRFRDDPHSSSTRPPTTPNDPVPSSGNKRIELWGCNSPTSVTGLRVPYGASGAPPGPHCQAAPAKASPGRPALSQDQAPAAEPCPAPSPGRRAAPRGRSPAGARPAGNAAPPPCWRRPPRRTAAAAAPEPRASGPAASRPPGEDAESREEGGGRSPSLAASLCGRPQGGGAARGGRRGWPRRRPGLCSPRPEVRRLPRCGGPPVPALYGRGGGGGPGAPRLPLIGPCCSGGGTSSAALREPAGEPAAGPRAPAGPLAFAATASGL